MGSMKERIGEEKNWRDLKRKGLLYISEKGTIGWLAIGEITV